MRPLDGHDLLSEDEECDLCAESPTVIDDASGWVACDKHAALLDIATRHGELVAP